MDANLSDAAEHYYICAGSVGECAHLRMASPAVPSHPSERHTHVWSVQAICKIYTNRQGVEQQPCTKPYTREKSQGIRFRFEIIDMVPSPSARPPPNIRCIKINTPSPYLSHTTPLVSISHRAPLSDGAHPVAILRLSSRLLRRVWSVAHRIVSCILLLFRQLLRL